MCSSFMISGYCYSNDNNWVTRYSDRFPIERKREKPKYFFLGLHGALTSTFPTYYDSPDGRPLIRCAFGSDFNIIIGESKISIGSGINYTKLEYTFDGEGFDRVDFFKFSTLNFPFSVHYNLLEKKKINPYFYLGGQLSSLLTNSYLSYRPFLYTEKLYVNGSILGFVSAGVGTRYKMFQTGSLFIQLNFYQGIVPIIYYYTSAMGVEKSDPNFLKYLSFSTGVVFSIFRTD